MTAGYALLAEAVSGGALWKRCFWKFSNNNLKTPVLESLFNKGLETCDLKRDSNTGVFMWILKKF